MSTVTDGETMGIVRNYHTLRNRLNQLLGNSGDAHPSTLAKLAECSRFLEFWERENIDHTNKLRASDSMSPERMSKIRTTIEQASTLLVHCEVALGVTSSEARSSDVSRTSDNHRDDCFHALEHKLRELRQPTASYYIEVPNAATTRITSSYTPSSPATSSSHVAAAATAIPYFDQILSPYTPAAQAPQTPRTLYEEPQVRIKEEQRTEQSPISDSFERVAHLRHDSHLGPHATSQESQFQNTLPPIIAWHHNTSSLAQIPSTSSYGPILPHPVPYHQSSPRDMASSPPTRYHSGSIDGNDHQTVLLLSQNSTLRPVQPPLNFSNHTMPALLTSMFPRPQSRGRGSSPDR